MVTSAGDCNYFIVRVKVNSCSQNMTFSCMVWGDMLHFKLLLTVLCISNTYLPVSSKLSNPAEFLDFSLYNDEI